MRVVIVSVLDSCKPSHQESDANIASKSVSSREASKYADWTTKAANALTSIIIPMVLCLFETRGLRFVALARVSKGFGP